MTKKKDKNKPVFCVFANQKGGVGKTTLCALFANRLRKEGYPVSVKDADLQASIMGHRKDDLRTYPDAEPDWDVTWVDATRTEGLDEQIAEWKQTPGVTLVDAPGSLALNGMGPILKAADVIAIPMNYDHDVLASTINFIKVLLTIGNKDTRLVFIPNRIDPRVGTHDEKIQQATCEDMLRVYGDVAPSVKQLAAIKRYSTLFGNDKTQAEATEQAFKMVERQF